MIDLHFLMSHSFRFVSIHFDSSYSAGDSGAMCRAPSCRPPRAQTRLWSVSEKQAGISELFRLHIIQKFQYLRKIVVRRI
jgi:hypothetical protein